MRLLTAGSLVRVQLGEPEKGNKIDALQKALIFQGFFALYGAFLKYSFMDT